MQSHPQEPIYSKPEPSPMAIIGAILAQGAIRIVLCNVVADLLKIERCQGRYQ